MTEENIYDALYFCFLLCPIQLIARFFCTPPSTVQYTLCQEHFPYPTHTHTTLILLVQFACVSISRITQKLCEELCKILCLFHTRGKCLLAKQCSQITNEL